MSCVLYDEKKKCISEELSSSLDFPWKFETMLTLLRTSMKISGGTVKIDGNPWKFQGTMVKLPGNPAGQLKKKFMS